MVYPQAYHITWGTYGVRLPGSDRPHVTKDQNGYGTPLPSTDSNVEEIARLRLKHDPVRLAVEHRQCVDLTVAELCERYRWTVHALAPQSDHVHIVITAMRVGAELREALKAVTCRSLNKQFIKQTWWAEGGSCKYLYDRSYFINATRYVERQREI